MPFNLPDFAVENMQSSLETRELFMPQEYSDNDMLNAAALGRRLGIGSSEAVQRRVKAGVLPEPTYQLGKNTARWRWGDVLSYLAKHNKGGDAA